MPTGTLTINVVDGARQAMAGRDILVSLWDGNQRRVHWAYHKASTVRFTVPLADNFVDIYRVVVGSKNCRDAGQTGVGLTTSPAVLDLLTLPRKPRFQWDLLADVAGHARRLLEEHLNSSFGGANQGAYSALQSANPEGLACFLNIASAFPGFQQEPLEFFERIESLHRDRVFALARPEFEAYLDTAVAEHIFEPAGSGLHEGFDKSYKETRFAEANVQFTLATKEKIGGLIRVDADIDYFSDQVSHGIMEVFPNDVIPFIFGTAKRLTNPQLAYAMRWMSMQRKENVSGLSFNPPYSIREQLS